MVSTMHGRQVFDSRGRPTVEVEVVLADGTMGRASLGPVIVPARFVHEDNLQLQLRLNGELKQNASTKDMIWSIAEQIASISEHVTLEPGDVILTGTPAGVGLGTGIWTKVGDSLDAEITGLGSLHVEIVEDHPDAQ
jgi:2-keto-4-pentenoate hydratase/2-oxohepta-3-ene-1,7-dioic acid hydratase in catechol pathway